MRKKVGGMKPQKGSVILLSAFTGFLLLFLLAGGAYFANYLRSRIFVERTTQLNEITAQVRVNLNNALDAHWNYLTAAVNLLETQSISTKEEASTALGRLELLLETRGYNSSLMLLDSQGNCYGANGSHGVWPDLDQIAGGGERYTFISDSPVSRSSHWTFVQKLPVLLRAGPNSPTPFF
ncbi:hypothetical protein AALC17_05745 [Oscillospiraceae bacterium 38-13]